MADFETKPMTIHIGAEIHGLDLTKPVTGKKGLFGNWAFTKHIEGVSREESETLLGDVPYLKAVA